MQVWRPEDTGYPVLSPSIMRQILTELGPPSPSDYPVPPDSNTHTIALGSQMPGFFFFLT